MSIDTSAQHFGVSFIFMYIAQRRRQQPHERIEPLQNLAQRHHAHIGRMAATHMRLLVEQNLPAALVIVAFRNDNSVRPTERNNIAGMAIDSNSVLAISPQHTPAHEPQHLQQLYKFHDKDHKRP